MKFVLVNGRMPYSQAFCACCCDPIGDSYLHDLVTHFSYCNHDCYLGYREMPEPGLQRHVSTPNTRVS